MADQDQEIDLLSSTFAQMGTMAAATGSFEQQSLDQASSLLSGAGIANNIEINYQFIFKATSAPFQPLNLDNTSAPAAQENTGETTDESLKPITKHLIRLLQKPAPSTAVDTQACDEPGCRICVNNPASIPPSAGDDAEHIALAKREGYVKIDPILLAEMKDQLEREIAFLERQPDWWMEKGPINNRKRQIAAIVWAAVEQNKEDSYAEEVTVEQNKEDTHADELAVDYQDWDQCEADFTTLMDSEYGYMPL